MPPWILSIGQIRSERPAGLNVNPTDPTCYCIYLLDSLLGIDPLTGATSAPLNPQTPRITHLLTICSAERNYGRACDSLPIQNLAYGLCGLAANSL